MKMIKASCRQTIIGFDGLSKYKNVQPSNMTVLMRKISYYLLAMPTIWSIGLGVLLVLAQSFWGNLPLMIQVPFFVCLMALTGIPHGAVDHLVEAETAKRRQQPFHLYAFLLKYVATMLVYAMAWYAFASASLLFFLLISAWHFGETDIEKAPNHWLWQGTRFVSGCFVLLFLLLTHVAETTPIIERISQNAQNVTQVWQWAVGVKNELLLSAFALSLGLFMLAYRAQRIELNAWHYGQLLVVLILTYFLPLLPAFALYFAGWHALCSFQNIHAYLGASSESHGDSSPFGLLKIWYQSLPFNLLAIGSLGAATVYWLYFLQSWDPLPLLFIFLSVVTLPHLNVMRAVNQAPTSLG